MTVAIFVTAFGMLGLSLWWVVESRRTIVSAEASRCVEREARLENLSAQCLKTLDDCLDELESPTSTRAGGISG